MSIRFCVQVMKSLIEMGILRCHRRLNNFQSQAPLYIVINSDDWLEVDGLPASKNQMLQSHPCLSSCPMFSRSLFLVLVVLKILI